MPRDVQQPELDFEFHLPAGRQWFRVGEVAHYCELSLQHVIDLVNEGRFTFDNAGPVNFAGKQTDDSGEEIKCRATTRIPRACVIAFLKANKQ